MTIFFIIILIIFGISLVLLEIILVPGLIVGFAGGLFMIMAIFWAWQVFGKVAGITTAAIVMVLLVLTIYFAFRSKMWKRFSLKGHIDGKVNVIPTEKVSIGDIGYAISSLRPMGTVRINNTDFEATAEGLLIPPNYPVEVIRVEPNKVIVKARTSSS